MEGSEFKPDDLVRVKSGGPVMTVEKVGITAMLQKRRFGASGSRRLGTSTSLRKRASPLSC
ncbi:DUF2158 domain-containing protein [Bradyrhizobium nanningense]|uniref:DUF2158 domain-containing protein n=1 Tax=Bradyrhizobium nanningense TaxID=1325118 RepID=UPI003D30EFE6